MYEEFQGFIRRSAKEIWCASLQNKQFVFYTVTSVKGTTEFDQRLDFLSPERFTKRVVNCRSRNTHYLSQRNLSSNLTKRGSYLRPFTPRNLRKTYFGFKGFSS